MMTALALILALILPVCPTEDSDMCHWDASASGNGIGSSFVSVNGEVLYLP